MHCCLPVLLASSVSALAVAVLQSLVAVVPPPAVSQSCTLRITRHSISLPSRCAALVVISALAAAQLIVSNRSVSADSAGSTAPWPSCVCSAAAATAAVRVEFKTERCVESVFI
jgi:hypothetical protein